PGKRLEPVEPRHREIEQDEVGLQRTRELDRLLAVGRFAGNLELVLGHERGERLAGQRVVVDDEDPHVLPSRLSARRVLPTRVNVRQDDKTYLSWLRDEVLLLGLLGAALALFVTYPTLRSTYELPQVRLVLDPAVPASAA